MELATISRIHKKGEFDRAERLYRDYLKTHPSDPFVYALLGTLHIQREQYGMAIELCRTALKIQPDFEESYSDLMMAYRRVGRTEEALATAQEAVMRFGERWERLYQKGKLHPERAQAVSTLLNNYGTCLFETGRHDEAQMILERALRYNPKHIDARWNLGISQLSQGNWGGWEGYEYGFRAGERRMRPYFDEYPDWKGEDLTDKTVLVWGEQGLGDEILFAQCLPDLQKLAGRIIFDCHPRMEKVFSRSFPGITCFGKRKDNTPGIFDGHNVDFQTPIGTLPLFFRNEESQFHGKPFLKARPQEVERWRTEAPGFRVGLAWRGGSQRTGQQKRSMTLHQMMNAYRVLPEAVREQVQLVALQYGAGVFEDADAEKQIDGASLYLNEGAIEDFEAQTDLTASCDLVISVVQTTVHLAGALGVKTFCLTPHGAPWKFPPGPRMPWHDSVTQFHQPAVYDWSQPLADAFNGLKEIIESRETAAA